MRTRFEIYCDILYRGLLNIRYSAGDTERCYTEADHLHNIPELLRNFGNEELHRYYWEAMRPSFVAQSKPEWLGRFQQLWQELEEASRHEAGAGADEMANVTLSVKVQKEADGRWLAEVPELPGVMAYGQTRAEAVGQAQALALRVLADRLDSGENVPFVASLFSVAS